MKVLPQAQLSVSCSIGVPVGDWLHPPLQPGALDDEVGERWLRHVDEVVLVAIYVLTMLTAASLSAS